MNVENKEDIWGDRMEETEGENDFKILLHLQNKGEEKGTCEIQYKILLNIGHPIQSCDVSFRKSMTEKKSKVRKDNSSFKRNWIVHSSYVPRAQGKSFK